MGMERVILFTK